MFWWFIICCLLIYLYLKLIKPHSYWKEKGVPYVKPFPVLGCMAGFFFQRKTAIDYMQEMYTAQNHKYFGVYQLVYPTLVLKDVNLIRQIAIKDFDHFTDHMGFLSEDAEPLFGKNLFALKGDRWRDMRSTLSPAFTSSKMRAMFVLISDCADQFINYFESKAASHTPHVIEMKDVFTRYANDVIGTCAFGVSCDSLKEKTNEFYMTGKEAFNFEGFKNFIIMMCHNVIPSVMKLFNIKFFSDQVRSFFHSLIKNSIAYREENGIIRPDMIHLLMEARKGRLKHEDNINNEYSDGFASVEESQIGKSRIVQKSELTDEDIVAQALIFFLAGFDTVSTLLTFISYELATNPGVQVMLQKEIDETYEKCKRVLTYETILKMKYLDMVVSETLRIWPPLIVVDRVCVKPYLLEPLDSNHKPVLLELDNIVWIPIYSIHHDPQYYPNPDKFDPERFNDENKINIQPFTFIPFGVGPRNCIGSRFALLEAKTIIFKILHKFDLVVVDKTQVPVKISKKQFNLATEKGLWLGLKLRNTKEKSN